MEINKELVEIYKEITQGEGTEAQLNAMLAVDINEMVQTMKIDITINQKNQLKKITNGLIKEVLLETLVRALGRTEEDSNGL